MEITTELIKKIYDRAMEYGTTIFDNTPQGIEIKPDGTIYLTFYFHNHDNYYKTVSATDISMDINECIEIKNKAQETKLLISNATKERELEIRRKQYEKLKKEFES